MRNEARGGSSAVSRSTFFSRSHLNIYKHIYILILGSGSPVTFRAWAFSALRKTGLWDLRMVASEGPAARPQAARAGGQWN